jgi:hypothetical protein
MLRIGIWLSICEQQASVKPERCETSNLYYCSTSVGPSIYANLNSLFLVSYSTHGNILYLLCTKFLK